MSQNSRKSSSASAKLAANFSNKAAKGAFSAAETGRTSAENVVKISSATMKDIFSTGAGEAQKAQEKFFSLGRESAEQLAKSGDAFSKAMVECVSASRDNAETMMECGNLAANWAKDFSSESFEGMNKAFADQVEFAREFFACRTLSDMFDLQNRMAQNAMEQFFSQSSKMSGLFFEYSSEAMEPINERVAQASEQFSKVIAAAA